MSLGPKPPEDYVNFVVDQLLPHAYLTILAGEPKCGKTAFATALAIAVATGEPFLGHRTVQGPVLWLSLEEAEDERAALFRHLPIAIREQAQTNPQEGMEPGTLPIYSLYNFPPIDTPGGITRLEMTCYDLLPKLVVIDSLHASHSGRSLADGWAARRTLTGLKRFSGSGAPPILVLHHLGGTRYRRRVAESAQLAATASMFWLMNELTSPEGGRRYHLECRGRGALANRHLYLESPSPLEYNLYQPEVVAPLPVAELRNPFESMVLEVLEDKRLTASQIVERVGQNPGSVRNAITRLQRQGEIFVPAIISGVRYYKKVTRQTSENDENDEKGVDSKQSSDPPLPPQAELADSVPS